MVRAAPSYLVVGHLQKAHGTRGELFVSPLTDRPEDVFVPGVRFRVSDFEGQAPEIGLPPLELESQRPFRQGFLARFEGVSNRNEAELIRGRYLLLPFEELPPLDEDEIHYHELLGMKVRTAAGEDVGEVVEVYELRPHHMLEVARPSGSVLIPFSRDVVTDIDRSSGVLTVEPPEGLLDL
jgi:16S rRNA processing protein RimM